MQDNETIAMTIIANAGDGKALAFDALEAASQGDFEKAGELLKQGDEASLVAHNTQSELLFAEANGEKVELDILLIHSQDHLITGMLAQELLKEMVKMYARIHELEKKVEQLENK